MALHKEDEEFATKWVETYITYDPSVVLYSTRDLVRVDNEKVVAVLKKLYADDKDEKSIILASILNAIFTQQTSAFSVTRRSVEALVKSDDNCDKKSIQPQSYGALKKTLTNKGFWEVIEEQSGSKPALFALKDKAMLELLKSEMFDKEFDKIHQERITAYYQMVGKIPSGEMDEFDIEVQKILEEQRAKRS